MSLKPVFILSLKVLFAKKGAVTNITEATRINWVALVEQNAGFAIAFAILLMGGVLAFTIIKLTAKQISTLQNLIGNHMVSNIKALKELTSSIKEHRIEATRRSEQLIARSDRTLQKIYKIE